MPRESHMLEVLQADHMLLHIDASKLPKAGAEYRGAGGARAPPLFNVGGQNSPTFSLGV